ncbi:NADH-quinone oxidoreductase subunit C [Myroides pelagicus]|uniref:NADH-quinone oxidoreductase subunit C n=1 Tax=Myroides pelagicus TaxID=270914 RepID=UPI002DB8602E|nr:NADH-quinone oxidoreductase subunit C [Myroides pelagicus]MEC4112969.1 NADH-quinone oxidoreductase subunit C [Myroides pelagicus]
MTLDNITIQKRLQESFNDSVVNFHEQHGMLVLEATSDKVHDIIKFLKEDSELNFNFLTDVCGINYAEEVESRQLAVVYHMHNWFDNVRIRIKTYLNIKSPTVDSVTDLFKSANWQERETYDFYGIIFKGHPQLKRILNMDTMESFPLRKDHPMEDGGRTDKDDRFFGRTVHNC